MEEIVSDLVNQTEATKEDMADWRGKTEKMEGKTRGVEDEFGPSREQIKKLRLEANSDDKTIGHMQGFTGGLIMS